jgi:hypothetical protein
MRDGLHHSVSGFRPIHFAAGNFRQTRPTALPDHRGRGLRRVALLDLHHLRGRHHHAG